jgi:dihydroneopterin aldolase
MGTIAIEGIELYAYHGCLEEEAKIGSKYRVDVYVDVDYSEAALSDDLKQTVDYGQVYDIVKKEMSERSKLLEHVARRIADSLAVQIPHQAKYKVLVTKYQPPVNGQVASCTVSWESEKA